MVFHFSFYQVSVRNPVNAALLQCTESILSFPSERCKDGVGAVPRLIQSPAPVETRMINVDKSRDVALEGCDIRKEGAIPQVIEC